MSGRGASSRWCTLHGSLILVILAPFIRPRNAIAVEDLRALLVRMPVLRATLIFALVGLLPGAPPLFGQEPFGELIDVRSGFTRVVVKGAAAPPRAGDFEVTWKGARQAVREVLGGPGSAIEVGIALDLSASMQRSLESMKAALRDFLRTELSAADRVFVVSFSDRLELLNDGLDASLDSLATLSIDQRPGIRPTRFFAGVDRALATFRNSSPRAVLLVASDGCDSLRQEGAGDRVLRQAAKMAIPIVLIAPGRRECRNTTCALNGSGEWICNPGLSPTFPSVRLAERDPADPTRGPLEVPPSSLGSPATIARDQFIGRLKAGGGAFLTARSDTEWTRGLDSVRSLLDRQWTVVFEPSSPAVQSAEVKVQVRDRSRP